jgi:hypothetical protein
MSATAAEDTCAQFAVLALSIDTATDHSPADARQRAAIRFGTPALAAQLIGDGRDPAWPALTQHHAHIDVTTSRIQDDNTNRSGGPRTGIAMLATRTAIGADGWRHPLPDIALYCSLILNATGWAIANVAFIDAAGGETP